MWGLSLAYQVSFESVLGELSSSRRAIVASSLGRAVGRVQGQTAIQIPHDAFSAK